MCERYGAETYIGRRRRDARLSRACSHILTYTRHTSAFTAAAAAAVPTAAAAAAAAAPAADGAADAGLCACGMCAGCLCASQHVIALRRLLDVHKLLVDKILKDHFLCLLQKIKIKK